MDLNSNGGDDDSDIKVAGVEEGQELNPDQQKIASIDPELLRTRKVRLWGEDWRKKKKKKRRGVKVDKQVVEERLSDIDDAEIDDYIIRGVDDDDDYLKIPDPDQEGGKVDIDGVEKLIDKYTEEREQQRDLEREQDMEKEKLKNMPQPIPPKVPMPELSQMSSQPGSQQMPGYPQGYAGAAYPYAGRPMGQPAPFGQLPAPTAFQPQPIPPHLKVPVYDPMPKPGAQLKQPFTPPGREEIPVPEDKPEFVEWRDAAVNTDRFDIYTLGRGLRADNAGKRVTALGQEILDYSGGSLLMRYSSFARCAFDINKDKASRQIHYMELICGGSMAPMYGMIGVLCSDETDFDHVTFPEDGVVWCQDGKVAHEWEGEGIRDPYFEITRRNLSRRFQYNDKIGVLVDRKRRQVGFIRNGTLLHDITIYDLPLDKPLHFIASVYEHGSDLTFTPVEAARQTLANLDWEAWVSGPVEKAFAEEQGWKSPTTSSISSYRIGHTDSSSDEVVDSDLSDAKAIDPMSDQEVERIESMEEDEEEEFLLDSEAYRMRVARKKVEEARQREEAAAMSEAERTEMSDNMRQESSFTPRPSSPAPLYPSDPNEPSSSDSNRAKYSPVEQEQVPETFKRDDSIAGNGPMELRSDFANSDPWNTPTVSDPPEEGEQQQIAASKARFESSEKDVFTLGG